MCHSKMLLEGWPCFVDIFRFIPSCEYRFVDSTLMEVYVGHVNFLEKCNFSISVFQCFSKIVNFTKDSVDRLLRVK